MRNYRQMFVLFILLCTVFFSGTAMAEVFTMNNGQYGDGSSYLYQGIQPVTDSQSNSLYKSTQNRGYLKAGEYDVYCFTITGQRSFIEWVLNGGCGVTPAPVMMMGGGTVITDWRAAGCGPDFNLYVYQNRDPRECGFCYADRADTSYGTNAYVGWRYPCQGCKYCVIVYCKNGAGYYDLNTNSYIGTSSSPQSTIMGSGYSDNGLFTEENVAPGITP